MSYETSIKINGSEESAVFFDNAKFWEFQYCSHPVFWRPDTLGIDGVIYKIDLGPFEVAFGKVDDYNLFIGDNKI